MPALSDTPRFDPVTPIHKAVRRLMFEVLGQVGALDASDIFEVDLCRKQVMRLTRLLPDTAQLLEPLLAGLYQQDGDGRSAAAQTLYQEVARLVSAQLVAQLKVEAEETPLLQVQHSDPELRMVRRRQLATMSEPELAEALHAMADALTPQELAAFVDDLQTSIDPQTFGCLLDTLRRQIAVGRWQRLARELGLPETGTSALPRLPGTTIAGDLSRPEPIRRGYRGVRSGVRTQ